MATEAGKKILDVAKGAADLMESGQENVKEARNRLVAPVEAINAACRRLEERTRTTAKATDQCIRAHPYETLSIVLGLGLLIGALMRRREA